MVLGANKPLNWEWAVETIHVIMLPEVISGPVPMLLAVVGSICDKQAILIISTILWHFEQTKNGGNNDKNEQWWQP